MDELDQNIEAFRKMQDELEKDSIGRWVLFHNSKLVDIFDDFEAAAEEATTKYGGGPYLIRQIGVSSVTLPVSVMGK